MPTAASGLKDIPIAREIPSVSPLELMMMPPVRKIEFVIDEVPGTAPISKAPYGMALVKLRELMEQLLELMDRELLDPESRLGEYLPCCRGDCEDPNSHDRITI